jgi:hypothetical protein
MRNCEETIFENRIQIALIFSFSGNFTVLTSFKTAPHNRYQPHTAEPEQYTICSNTVFDLLKMGIMMPETC